MKYLVDTDWVIHHLKGNEEVRNKIKELISFGIAISAVSVAELYEGVYASKDPAKDQQALENLLPSFSFLGVDQEICKIFGRERGKLRQQKKVLDNFDLLIASTALHHNLTLLTNNRKHFEQIVGLEITSLEKDKAS